MYAVEGCHVTLVIVQPKQAGYAETVIKPSQLTACGRPEEGQTLNQPMRHLLACHRRIEERLDTLERVIPHWRSRTSEALAAVRASFRFFDTNGVWHTGDEEQSIFPRLQGSLTAEERDYIEELERQHDAAEAAYAALRDIVSQLDEDAVSESWMASYETAARRLSALYREHIASEDDRLFAIGSRVLNERELQQISEEMHRRRGLL